MVKHEQKSAFNIHVTRPLDLETIRLLSGGHSMPLKDKRFPLFINIVNNTATIKHIYNKVMVIELGW